MFFSYVTAYANFGRSPRLSPVGYTTPSKLKSTAFRMLNMLNFLNTLILK